jgi:hypothetical protein
MPPSDTTGDRQIIQSFSRVLDLASKQVAAEEEIPKRYGTVLGMDDGTFEVGTYETAAEMAEYLQKHHGSDALFVAFRGEFCQFTANPPTIATADGIFSLIAASAPSASTSVGFLGRARIAGLPEAADEPNIEVSHGPEEEHRDVGEFGDDGDDGDDDDE